MSDTDDADSWMFMVEVTDTEEIKQWPEFVWRKYRFILSFSIQDYWHGQKLKYLYYVKSEIPWYLLLPKMTWKLAD